MSTTYNIDRNTASRLLNVSIRTVDRYLKQDKLSSVRSDGRIWLSKEEILDLLRGKQVDKSTPRHETRRLHVDVDNYTDNHVEMATPRVDSADNRQQYRQNNYEGSRQRPHYAASRERDIDTAKMVEELKEGISIRDKRLAQASYKIGQLEMKITSMVPLLELESQQKLLLARNEEFEQRLTEKDGELVEAKEEYEDWLQQKDLEKLEIDNLRLEQLSEKNVLINKLDEDLHMEKVNKWVYAIILYILVLGLILLWVVLKFI